MSEYGPFVRTAFPDGSEVFYRDEGHSYWRAVKRNPKAESGWSGSGRLTGISTVSEPFDFRPDALLRWVERLTLEGVARGFQGRTVPADPHVLRTSLENRNLRWEQIRDEAGAAGTNIHLEMLEALAGGLDIPDLASLPEEQRGKGQAVMKFWLDHEPEPLLVEQCVLCSEHGCAGRLDLRYRITKGPSKGRVALVDLKTGGFIPTKAHVQVAGYDLSVAACGLGASADELWILQVFDDGTYALIPVQASHEDFVAALEVYRRASRIANEARKQRTVAAAPLPGVETVPEPEHPDEKTRAPEREADEPDIMAPAEEPEHLTLEQRWISTAELDAAWRREVEVRLSQYADLVAAFDDVPTHQREAVAADIDALEGVLDGLGVPIGWQPPSTAAEQDGLRF